MRTKNQIKQIVALSLLGVPLLAVAVLTTCIAFNLITLPIPEHWLIITKNVGYNIFAGSVLIFLVAIFNRLSKILTQ